MLKINKIILSFTCAIMLFIPTAKANSLHNMQDKIPTDKALHFAAGYIIQDQLERNAHMSKLEAVATTAIIAWAKEKYVDENIDNADAYATIAGALFYQIKF